MDIKRLILGFALALAVMLGWSWFVQGVLYKKYPHWNPANRVATTQPIDSTATTMPAAPATQDAPLLATTQPGDQSVELATTAPSGTATAQATGLAVASAPEQRVVQLGQDAERFPLQITLASTEAAVESVLIRNLKAYGGRDEYIFQTPYAGEKPQRAFATSAITINGETIDLSSAVWAVETLPASEQGQDVAFTLNIVRDGSTPVARLRKTYRLKDAKSESKGYELVVWHEIRNLTEAPMTARLTYAGPTVPPSESERGPDRQVLIGFADERSIDVEHHYTESFSGDETTRSLLVNEDEQPMVWVGTSSIYFDAIARPLPRDPEARTAEYLDEVSAKGLNPNDVHRNVVISMRTKDLTLPPSENVILGTEAFLGPRQRKLLNETHYAQFPRMYDKTLVLTSGPCGFCTFPQLVNLLVSLLAGFHFILRDWGLAIICLVVLVRLLLHPITKRSQLSMMKMAKMGPEIERLKKKYGDNKDELNRAMMDVYKEQGFTPILGCLPMFLQMPIWIALWQALQTTFELRQAPFLYGLTWIDDLARPDHLIDFERSIPLVFGWAISGINLLPILLAVVFYLQQKMMPKPAATTPEQEQQQRMMQYMTLIFPVFLYNGPAGLNIYILTSTVWGIIESKIVRRHAQRLEEEAKKDDKVIVETKATRASRRRGEGKEPEPKRKTGLAGWLQQLQERAEEIKRNAEERGR